MVERAEVRLVPDGRIVLLRSSEWPRFSLEDSLATGLVPLVVDAPDSKDVLAAYATLYLEQEVQAESMVRNLGQFVRFLEAVSFSHASVLNVSNLPLRRA